MDHWISEHCDTKLSRMSHCHISCHVCTCSTTDVRIYTLCACKSVCMCVCMHGSWDKMGRSGKTMNCWFSLTRHAVRKRQFLPFPVSSLPPALPLFFLFISVSFTLCTLRCILHLLFTIPVHLEVISGHTLLEQSHLSERLLSDRLTGWHQPSDKG